MSAAAARRPAASPRARVHQLLSGAGPYDAVTTQSLTYRRLFRDWGLDGQVFAGAIEPSLDGTVRPAARLEEDLAEGDLLLIHYSAADRALGRVLDLPQRKLLVYHNITPAEYLWDFEPLVAAQCSLGRERLRELAPRVDVALAVSEYNAGELREAGFGDVRVVPNLFDRGRLEAGARAASPYRDGKVNVLFVGRLSPHKRPDELIKAFALYQRHREADSRLILAGSPLSPPYRERLERLAAAAGARDVVFTGPVPQEDLNGLYAASHVFACLSEHEGFCIPLLEAFHFGLPVIAYRAGGVPEVAGDAAVLLGEKDLPTIAELIDMCACDEGLRAELRRRGEARLQAFSFERTAGRLREVVEGLL